MTYRNTKITVIKFYTIIQIVIYLIPFYLLTFVNIHHTKYDESIRQFYDASLLYIFIFDFLLISTLLSLNKIFPVKILSFDSQSTFLEKLSTIEIKVFIIAMLLICIVCDIVLYHQGINLSSNKPPALVFLSLDQLPTFIFQPMKVIANLKYVIFLCVLYLQFSKSQYKFLGFFLLIYLIIYGLIIGSRYSTLLPIILLLIVYRDIFFKNKIRVICLIIFGTIGVAIIFPFLSISRNIYMETGTIKDSEPIYNLFSKLEWVINKYIIHPQNVDKFGGLEEINKKYFPWFNYFENTIIFFTKEISNILSGRLNYLHINAEVMKLTNNQDLLGISYYLDNIFGLIPRFLWMDKPIITNNSDVIGFQMGLQPTIDKTLHFAIGLRPIGESFLAFSWPGILFAIPCAILFYIITLILNNKYSLHSLYLFYCIEFLKNDTFHVIVPSFFNYIVGCIIFICFFFFVKITSSLLKKKFDIRKQLKKTIRLFIVILISFRRRW